MNVQIKSRVIVNCFMKIFNLYSDFSRYEFTHEILGESESTFKNQSISRDRRVSIICRNEPVSTPGPVFKPLISN